MQRIKKGLKLLKTGNFKKLFSKIGKVMRHRLYCVRARIEDWRIGGISIDKKKPTRFADKGAYATESTNYLWLDRIFKTFPLKKDDVFLDVGCGEGRVLTYLYLRGFRGKLMGIELDPDVADTAARRTRKCPNIQIHQGNILECGQILRDVTAVYLFNPFKENILTGFVELLEKTCDHPVTVYYCNDLYRRVLDKRENWFILRRNVLESYNFPPRGNTVYRYRPEK